jgi:hypothetical protein
MDYWNSLVHPDNKEERIAIIKDLINNKKQNQKKHVPREMQKW